MYNLESEILNVNQYLMKHKKKFNIEIGDKIREIRINKKITKDQMAFQTMMSPTYITQIENGINGITLNKFIAICNTLKITPNYILNDFMFLPESNEEIFYDELQKGKNLTENILEYLKIKQ